MSVENFSGDGFADQPSIIYAYDGGDEIRELSRSTDGSLADVAQGGPLTRPGDVIERESTKSKPTNRLPELPLPGYDGIKRDDCGEDIPAFACSDCGNPVYVARTCGSPACERCWESAVKRKTVRLAGKLEGMRRMLYARHNGNKDIDFNHVIASLPDFAVDSKQPVERALKVLKTLLETQWGIDGFCAIMHCYRIKKEYRKDQYEHGGESGEGTMTWKDVLTSDNPSKYIYFSPHFHIFFPAVRKSFDYSITEAVEDQTGWMFHRITKGEDSNVSVSNLDDLVHQVTYCFSHCGVNDWHANRKELTSRMKGDLHNCYIPDGVEDKCLASFCDAAPKLLGARFTNVAAASCDAEVSTTDSDIDHSHEDCECCDDEASHHPLHDVFPSEQPASTTQASTTTSASISSSGSGSSVNSHSEFAAGRDSWAVSSPGNGTMSSSSSSSSVTNNTAATTGSKYDADADEGAHESPLTDNREPCGGDLEPMYKAKRRLNDTEWCQQAQYIAGLRTAVREWERRTGGEDDRPWVGGDLDDDLDTTGDVIQGD